MPQAQIAPFITSMLFTIIYSTSAFPLSIRTSAQNVNACLFLSKNNGRPSILLFSAELLAVCLFARMAYNKLRTGRYRTECCSAVLDA